MFQVILSTAFITCTIDRIVTKANNTITDPELLQASYKDFIVFQTPDSSN